MPVLGSIGFQDAPRKRTNFCGQQPEETLEHRREIERCDRGTITLRTQMSTDEGMIQGNERISMSSGFLEIVEMGICL